MSRPAVASAPPTAAGPQSRKPPGQQSPRAGSMRRPENRTGLALMSPTLIVIVVVVLPILWTVLLAFQRIRLIDAPMDVKVG